MEKRFRVRQNTAQLTDRGTYLVYGNCLFSGNYYQVEVEAEALKRFVEGRHAQKCFPEMNRDDREFLISGISPEGWSATFGTIKE